MYMYIYLQSSDRCVGLTGGGAGHGPTPIQSHVTSDRRQTALSGTENSYIHVYIHSVYIYMYNVMYVHVHVASLMLSTELHVHVHVHVEMHEAGDWLTCCVWKGCLSSGLGPSELEERAPELNMKQDKCMTTRTCI